LLDPFVYRLFLTRMRKVTIYSKADCHLCDIAKERVLKVQKRVPFDLEVVDIRSTQALFDRYCKKIPVVTIDEEEVFVFRVSEKLLTTKLRAKAG
jgi:glutaredoxin